MRRAGELRGPGARPEIRPRVDDPGQDRIGLTQEISRLGIRQVRRGHPAASKAYSLWRRALTTTSTIPCAASTALMGEHSEP